jgi:hypothetical protein
MEKTSFEHYHDVHVLEEPHDEFGEPVWTEDEERAVRRSLDWHIVPVVTLLYLLCFSESSEATARLLVPQEILTLVTQSIVQTSATLESREWQRTFI